MVRQSEGFCPITKHGALDERGTCRRCHVAWEQRNGWLYCIAEEELDDEYHVVAYQAMSPSRLATERWPDAFLEIVVERARALV